MNWSDGLLEYWSIGKSPKPTCNLNRFFHYSIAPSIEVWIPAYAGYERVRLGALARRSGVDGERVHTTFEFARQRAVDHAVAFQPGLPFERLRHDINAEMRLPARPVPGMAFVLVGFVQHLEALRRESLGQLFCDHIGRLHASRLKEGWPAGQWPLRGGIEQEPLLSSLERVIGKGA